MRSHSSGTVFGYDYKWIPSILPVEITALQNARQTLSEFPVFASDRSEL